MRELLFTLVSLLSVAGSLQIGGVTRGGSGIQIGTSDRGHAKGTGVLGGRGHSGVKLGEARFPNSTRQRPFTTTTTTPPPPTTRFIHPPNGNGRGALKSSEGVRCVGTKVFTVNTPLPIFRVQGRGWLTTVVSSLFLLTMSSCSCGVGPGSIPVVVVAIDGSCLRSGILRCYGNFYLREVEASPFPFDKVLEPPSSRNPPIGEGENLVATDVTFNTNRSVLNSLCARLFVEIVPVQGYFRQEIKSNFAGQSERNGVYEVGMMVPHKSFGVREYTKAVTSAMSTLQKSSRARKLGLFQHYDIHVKVDTQSLTPSPTVRSTSILGFIGRRQSPAGRSGSSDREIGTLTALATFRQHDLNIDRHGFSESRRYQRLAGCRDPVLIRRPRNLRDHRGSWHL
ncbi:hypothetical protein WN48_01555 [Eufriesea mexicana]|nr:hypothetical protein WN48_01555 [Eufriesea mexicana]